MPSLFIKSFFSFRLSAGYPRHATDKSHLTENIVVSSISSGRRWNLDKAVIVTKLNYGIIAWNFPILCRLFWRLMWMKTVSFRSACRNKYSKKTFIVCNQKSFFETVAIARVLPFDSETFTMSFAWSSAVVSQSGQTTSQWRKPDNSDLPLS